MWFRSRATIRKRKYINKQTTEWKTTLEWSSFLPFSLQLACLWVFLFLQNMSLTKPFKRIKIKIIIIAYHRKHSGIPKNKENAWWFSQFNCYRSSKCINLGKIETALIFFVKLPLHNVKSTFVGWNLNFHKIVAPW